MKNKINKYIGIFVLEVILFWVLWFAYGYVWLNNYDNTSNVLRIVMLIWLIIIVLSAVSCFVLIIRETTKKSKVFPVAVFIIFVLIHLGMYLKFSSMAYSTSGIFNIVDKKVEESEYYFYIDNTNQSGLVKIECEQDIYEKLLVDENVSYTFTYRWLTYNNDIGVLQGNVDMENIIDNR